MTDIDRTVRGVVLARNTTLRVFVRLRLLQSSYSSESHWIQSWTRQISWFVKRQMSKRGHSCPVMLHRVGGNEVPSKLFALSSSYRELETDCCCPHIAHVTWQRCIIHQHVSKKRCLVCVTAPRAYDLSTPKR